MRDGLAYAALSEVLRASSVDKAAGDVLRTDSGLFFMAAALGERWQYLTGGGFSLAAGRAVAVSVASKDANEPQ